MKLSEAWRSAMSGLRANKLRSTLTTLGIVIGVAAVIILVALGNGIQTGFNRTFSALATQITVDKLDGSVPGGGAARELTDTDVTALGNRTQAPDIASATPVITGTALLRTGDGNGLFRASVAGSTPDYLAVNNRELLVGSFFTETEARANARVVVLGPKAVTSLFGGDAGAALGQRIRIGRISFKVIGVVTRNGQQDDTAIMPAGTARSYLLGGGDKVNQIIVKATSTSAVPAALDQITQILDQRHNIRDQEKADFEATALQTLLDQSNQFLGYLTLFTVAVAAISLIVGGIGIANIMLVSVTERTREIGIRKAVGARRGAILKQFLIESMALSGLGGLLGVAVGIGIVLAAAVLVPRSVPNFPPPSVSPGSVLVAFTVSLAIGLLAGCYPAIRAARLRPIEALRYE